MSLEELKLDDESLMKIVKKSFNTNKIGEELKNKLSKTLIEATKIMKIADKPLDISMLQTKSFVHKFESDVVLVNGVILDHGPRHPKMKKNLKNCFILTCNISMDYDKS